MHFGTSFAFLFFFCDRGIGSWLYSFIYGAYPPRIFLFSSKGTPLFHHSFCAGSYASSFFISKRGQPEAVFRHQFIFSSSFTNPFGFPFSASVFPVFICVFYLVSGLKDSEKISGFIISFFAVCLCFSYDRESPFRFLSYGNL